MIVWVRPSQACLTLTWRNGGRRNGIFEIQEELDTSSAASNLHGAESHRDIRIAHGRRYFLIGEMGREHLVSLPSAYGLRLE